MIINNLSKLRKNNPASNEFNDSTSIYSVQNQSKTKPGTEPFRKMPMRKPNTSIVSIQKPSIKSKMAVERIQ
jgi:hypothetical protein